MPQSPCWAGEAGAGAQQWVVGEEGAGGQFDYGQEEVEEQFDVGQEEVEEQFDIAQMGVGEQFGIEEKGAKALNFELMAGQQKLGVEAGAELPAC